jgi:hypothetical protein
MRSRVLARRILLAPVIGLAFITAACSSSSSGTTASPPASSAAGSSPAAPPASPSGGSSAPASSSSGNAVSEIKTDWESFFSGKTSAATKISLLQNGQQYASVINAQAGSGLAASATATVTAVVLESGTTATVSYNIGVSGASLNNRTGTAVLEDGVWKVGDISFCQLLTLENGGTAPAICKSAG